MNLSWKYLRWGFVLAVFFGSLTLSPSRAHGFGQPCPKTGEDYYTALCRTGCAAGGYCTQFGVCSCGYIP
jgi:hypothetical protein